MTTYSTTIYSSSYETTVPQWMREERYLYCDQFYKNYYGAHGTSLWNKIKTFFHN